VDSEVLNRDLAEGTARLYFSFDQIVCEVENSAPDFVDIKKDKPILTISVQDKYGDEVVEFDQDIKLKLNSFETDDSTGRAIFKTEEDGIFIDLNYDTIKDVWIGTLVLNIESNFSRYLHYYVREADHTLEWFQKDEKSGEIKSLSATKKKYKPPKVTGKEEYTSKEVMRTAEMLYRAIKKIDLRTKSAYVKFNTDKGRLEPLIIGLADKLGYQVQPLDKHTIRELEQDEISASHHIKLK